MGQGSHEELLALKGKYYQLWEMQQGNSRIREEEEGNDEAMKNYIIFFRTFIAVIVIEMIFNLCDMQDSFGLEFLVTTVADVICAGIMGAASVSFLHVAKREVSYEIANKVMRQFSHDISSEAKKMSARLPWYKRFFMGDIVYDETEHMLYGPYIIINKGEKK